MGFCLTNGTKRPATVFGYLFKINGQLRVVVVLALELEYQHQPQIHESPNELRICTNTSESTTRQLR